MLAPLLTAWLLGPDLLTTTVGAVGDPKTEFDSMMVLDLSTFQKRMRKDNLRISRIGKSGNMCYCRGKERGWGCCRKFFLFHLLKK